MLEGLSLDNMKVEIVPVEFKGRVGYDILVKNETATVQDYIDALDWFIENNKCYRSRSPQNENCIGCDLCCQERIPVTQVDALKISGHNLKTAFKDRLHVYVEDRVVDITMGLDEEGRCRFLDRETGKCLNYANRPLVCHTFICCPSTGRARQLREEVVNTGEDELVRSWFGVKTANGLPVIHEGIDPAPDIRDYGKTPFNGVDEYNQIKLKDICSPGLWKKLYRQ